MRTRCCRPGGWTNVSRTPTSTRHLRPVRIRGTHPNSARAGGVAEELWEVFAAGQPVTVEEYPSALPGYVILQRARSHIRTKYQLFDWNCEHLVSHALQAAHLRPAARSHGYTDRGAARHDA
jgi:hypothetical protein